MSWGIFKWIDDFIKEEEEDRDAYDLRVRQENAARKAENAVKSSVVNSGSKILRKSYHVFNGIIV